MLKASGCKSRIIPAPVPQPGLRQCYLGGTIGLVFSFSGTAALANSGNTTFAPLVNHIPHGQNIVAWPASNIHGVPGAPTLRSKTPILNGTALLGNGPGDLNLGSASNKLPAALLGNFNQLTIDVGGKSTVLNVNTSLTDAEYVAAGQVLAGGKQTLVINKEGVASGGSLSLNTNSLSLIDSAMGGTIHSLDVPTHVSVIDDLTNLNLSGALVNYGTVLGQARGGVTISADSILNAGSGTITAGRGTDLTLRAQSSITNYGTMSSGKDLNFSAASLTNINNSANVGKISTPQNLIIDAAAVTNSGLIRSSNANVQFTNANTITVNNGGGTIEALKGNINVRDASYTGLGGITINGGNLLSQQLNLNAAGGNVDIDANQITGVISGNAACSHIETIQGNLLLGNYDVTGDPTYYNQLGNVVIKGILPTGGNDLAIVAGGSILSDGGVLDTSNQTGNGGTLTLVAGANFTSNGGTTGTNDTSSILTFTDTANPGNGSKTGGMIDLTGKNGGTAAIGGINTTSANGGNGGNLIMIAYAGSGGKSGTINIPTNVPILTGGAQTQNGGRVYIDAGAGKGACITIGDINTSGTSASGSIFITDVKPTAQGVTIQNGMVSGNFSTVLSSTSGNMSIGSITAPGGAFEEDAALNFHFITINVSGFGGTATAGAIGADGGNGGDVQITASGTVTGGSIFAFGGGGGGGAGGFAGGNGGNGGIVGLSGNTIILSGGINTAGGGGGGGGGATEANPAVFGNGGNGGFGGNVSLAAQKALSVAGTLIACNGGAGGSGSIGVAANASGSGGGGGGSLGGGGGGGAVGAATDQAGSGGGGGGGAYGGGGGGNLNQGGAGAGGGAAGSVLAGGSGATNGSFLGGNGGTFSQGGGGGASFSGPASNGINTIQAGGVLGANGQIQLTLSTGSVGTALSPVQVITPHIALGSTSGSFFITDGAGLQILNAQELQSTKGTLQLSTAGDLTANVALVGTVNLSTLPGSNGSISYGFIQGISANLIADGTGSINTIGPSPIINETKSITLTAGSGGIGMSASPAITQTPVLSANATGNVFVTNTGDLVLQASSAAGAQGFSVVTSGNLTVQGVVTATQGVASVALVSQKDVTLKANIDAQMIGVQGNNITEAGVVQTGAGPSVPSNLTLTFNGDLGSAGAPFKVDLDSIILGGVAGPSRNAFITSTNTGVEGLTNTVGGGTLIYTTPASGTMVASGPFTNQTISDTAKTLGNIVVSGLIGDASGPGTITISTKGGEIFPVAGTIIDAATAILSTAGGNIGASGAALEINSFSEPNVSVQAGNGQVFLKSADSLNISSATAGVFNAQSNFDISTSGKISATIVSLTAGDSLVLESTIIGNNITLNSTLAIETGTIVTTGANPIISIQAQPGEPILLSGQVGSGTGAITISGGPFIGTSLIDGSDVNLVGNGNFGSAANPLNVIASGTLNIDTTASAFIQSSANLTLGTAITGAASSLSVVSSGTLTANGFVSTNTINLVGSALVFTGGCNLGAATGTLTATKGNFTVEASGIVLIGVDTVTASNMVINGVLETSATPLAANGTLIIQNPSGALSISGVAGGISNAQIETLSATGNLTLGPQVLDVLAPASESHVLTITAGKTLSLPTNDVGVSPTLVVGTGGQLAVSAANITYLNSAATPLTLDASSAATAGANAGSVTLTLTGKTTQTVGGGGNQIFLQAIGDQNGGFITFTNGGAININSGDLQALAGTGLGGNITLTAGGNMAITGGIDLSGTQGGQINIQANGSKPFIYDSANPIVNGISGAITNASQVFIANPAGVTIASGSTLSTSIDIGFSTASLVNDGTINTPFLDAGGAGKSNFIVSQGVGANWGNPSQVDFGAKGSINLGPLFTASAQLSPSNIQISSVGTLTIGTNIITAAANGTLGGTIQIVAGSIIYQNMKTQPLSLNAPGPNTAASTGGGIAVVETASVTVGAGAGDLQLNVAPVMGNNGGRVLVTSAGGNLTVDANSLGTNLATPNPAINSTVSLSAGKNLVVNNFSDLTIGTGGKITLDSKSATPFMLGPIVSKNGMTINSTLIADTVNIGNTGGGITLAQSINAATATNLTATGTIAESTGVTVVVPTLTISGGSIGTAATGSGLFAITSSSLAASATGKKGNAFITDNNGVIVNSGAAGSTFDLTTTAGLISTQGPILAPNVNLTTTGSGLIINGNIGSGGGAITFNTSGGFAGVTQNSGLIAGNSLQITTFAVANPLQTTVASLGGAAAVFEVNNVGSAPLTLQAISGQVVTVTTNGALDIAGAIGGGAGTASYNLSATGPITISNNIGISTGATVIQSIGAITNTKGASAIQGATVTLSAGAGGIGSSKAPLRISGGTYTLATPGIINLDNTSGALALNSLIAPASSFQLTSNGPVGLNNISTTNGSINLTITSSELIIADNAILSAKNGNINLQDTDMTAGNQMIIGKNVVIHASATAAKLGEVNIFFGPVLPSTKTLTATTSITNGQVTDTGGGQLFVGTNLVQLNTPTNFLNAFGRNIILDTGTLPTGSILFFGGDTVTADPPPGAAGATAPAIVAMPPAMVVPMMNTFAAAASSTAANAFATTMTSQVANTLATTMTSPVANTPVAAITSPAVNALATTINASATTIQTEMLSAPASSIGIYQGMIANVAPGTIAGMVPGNVTSEFAIFSDKQPGNAAAARLVNCQNVSQLSGGVSNNVIRAAKHHFGDSSDGIDRRRRRMEQGALLFAPEKDTSIDTPFGCVKISSHSLAFVILTDSALSVFDLDDRHKDSVLFTAAGETISLSPGRHVTVAASNTKTFADINPARFVGHRQLGCREMQTGAKSFQSEFQLASLLTGLQAMHSQAWLPLKNHTKTTGHLIKTTAIIATLSASAEEYRLQVPPELAAMNK